MKEAAKQERGSKVPGKKKGRSSRKGRRRRGRRGRRTRAMIGIARERMDILMEMSERSALKGDTGRSRRYAGLARKIGMRYNVRMRSRHRRLLCRRCGAFLLPSRTARVRIRRGRRITHCKECGNVERIPLKHSPSGPEDPGEPEE